MRAIPLPALRLMPSCLAAVAAVLFAAAAHAQGVPPAPGPSAVQPAPAMTPSGRVTPGGVRNAHRQEELTAQQAAGAAGAAVVPGTGLPAPLVEPAPASMWTAAQARDAFRFADRDADGTLSRAEAQRLPLLPRTFEDLDANKDGLLDVNEYLAGFQR